jgi:hypothetical protein
VTHPVLLSDVNRWVGVSMALVGAFVVAPSGTTELFESAWRWLEKTGRQALSQLARLLRFRKQDVNVVAPSAGVMSSSNVSATLTAAGRVWNPTAPLDERIAALRQHIVDVEGKVNEASQQLRQETSDRQRDLAKLQETLHTEIAEIRRLIADEERQSVLIDARGLPVLALGILLSGIPDELASIPLYLGWLFPVGGVTLAVRAVSPLLRGWFRPTLRRWFRSDP